MYAAILILIWSVNGPNGGTGGSSTEIEQTETKEQCQKIADAFYVDTGFSEKDVGKRFLQDFMVIRKARCVKLGGD